MHDQQQRIKEKLRLASSSVYEIISREGAAELARSLPALAWSGLAAGFCICFSMLAEAYFKMHLPDHPAKPLVENIGYTFGFIIVIMGRLQLFTENTITVMLPLFDNPAWRNLKRTLNLWVVVFSANLIGTFIVAMLLTKFSFASVEQLAAVFEVSHHAVHRPLGEVFIQGIPAGFLIAALVWMLPSAENNEFFVIFMMTYLIAIGDFTHVVAGSAEAFVLMLGGDISIASAWGYIGAAGAGNVIGGTGLFALLAYAQVRDEI
ncbi:MAG: formate/nitrite transporter family protein [Alphaproteobacteria bacterium]